MNIDDLKLLHERLGSVLKFTSDLRPMTDTEDQAHKAKFGDAAVIGDFVITRRTKMNASNQKVSPTPSPGHELCSPDDPDASHSHRNGEWTPIRPDAKYPFVTHQKPIPGRSRRGFLCFSEVHEVRGVSEIGRHSKSNGGAHADTGRRVHHRNPVDQVMSQNTKHFIVDPATNRCLCGTYSRHGKSVKVTCEDIIVAIKHLNHLVGTLVFHPTTMTRMLDIMHPLETLLKEVKPDLPFPEDNWEPKVGEAVMVRDTRFAKPARLIGQLIEIRDAIETPDIYRVMLPNGTVIHTRRACIFKHHGTHDSPSVRWRRDHHTKEHVLEWFDGNIWTNVPIVEE